MNTGWLLLAALCAAAALALLLPRDTFIAGMQGGDFVANAAYGLVAVALAGSLLHRYRGRLGAGLRDALIWIGLAITLVAGYAHRDLLEPVRQRVMAELSPGSVITPSPGVAEVARRRDGHYAVDMLANGAKLTFVFDTGASSVVLRAEDAAKIGIDVSKLNFSQMISTANGASRAAEIMIDRLSAGSISQQRVRALVARPGTLNENLLGMTFLEKLAFYGVENNKLVLRSR